MHSRDKQNNRAIVIGIILMSAVALVTILRPWLAKKDQKITPATAQDVTLGKSLTSPELMDMINHKENMVMIDIRDADSFNSGHILNSKNISLDNIGNSLSTFDKTKTYILIDDGESASVLSLARDIFPSNGLTNTYYLSGGFSDWKSQDYPVIADGDPYSLADQSKVSYISSDDLKKSLDNNEDIYILDLRKPATFSDGHIKNSANIFLDDLEKRYKEIPLGKKVILVDNDGLWAFKGAVKLFDMGVFNVFALSDGVDGWKQKGYEIVKN